MVALRKRLLFTQCGAITDDTGIIDRSNRVPTSGVDCAIVEAPSYQKAANEKLECCFFEVNIECETNDGSGKCNNIS